LIPRVPLEIYYAQKKSGGLMPVMKHPHRNSSAFEGEGVYLQGRILTGYFPYQRMIGSFGCIVEINARGRRAHSSVQITQRLFVDRVAARAADRERERALNWKTVRGN
jgi:hypothetical protein